MKVFLGGLLGGVVLFLWGGVSHGALGLMESAFRKLPNEERLVQTLASEVPTAGMYFYPGLPATDADEAEAASWKTRMESGPHGILVHLPAGNLRSDASLFATQAFTDIVIGLLAAWLVSRGGPALAGYGARVVFVTALGVVAVLSLAVPFWNWYGFTQDFTARTSVDRIVGFALAGLVIAKLVRPAAR